MPLWLKRMGFGLCAASVCAAAALAWQHENVARLWAARTLFDADRIVANFSAMHRSFRSVALEGAAGTPLPEADAMVVPEEAAAWLEDVSATGVVVLRDGAVVHEDYRLGTGPEDRRISWSVSKSILSLLTGILVDEGRLTLADLASDHVPTLAFTAYADVTVEDLLQMESGVRFDEDHRNPRSDINRMGLAVAFGGALDRFAASLTRREAEPGERWKYVSFDAHVLGMVLRGATGESVASLLSDRLLSPLGIEGAAYLTDGAGVAFVLGGLLMRTRDYARIGLMVAQGGVFDGGQVVPRAWIERSTVASARTKPDRWGYGYQWWIPPNSEPGQVLAQGIYGQYIWIDAARGVVVAVNAADRRFAERGRGNAAAAAMRQLAGAAIGTAS